MANHRVREEFCEFARERGIHIIQHTNYLRWDLKNDHLVAILWYPRPYYPDYRLDFHNHDYPQNWVFDQLFRRHWSASTLQTALDMLVNPHIFNKWRLYLIKDFLDEASQTASHIQ